MIPKTIIMCYGETAFSAPFVYLWCILMCFALFSCSSFYHHLSLFPFQFYCLLGCRGYLPMSKQRHGWYLCRLLGLQFGSFIDAAN